MTQALVFYDYSHFEILAVCMGKKTHRWTDFMFIRSHYLKRHSKYPSKLAVMHQVPIPGSQIDAPWYSSLEALLKADPE